MPMTITQVNLAAELIQKRAKLRGQIMKLDKNVKLVAGAKGEYEIVLSPRIQDALVVSVRSYLTTEIEMINGQLKELGCVED